jgi:hypothetical protein
MPLWQAAPPRGAGAAVAGLAVGAAAGLAGAAIGLAGAKAGWADACCCGPHANVRKMAPKKNRAKNRAVEWLRMWLPVEYEFGKAALS